MIANKIWLSSPHMGGDEIKFINDAFNSNWVAPLGPNVDGFEKDLGVYLSLNNVAVLNSGTSAIHLALILLGVGVGDEVICQSFTFSATANPIIYQGATPIFVDSEAETWNMNPDLLRDAILDRLEKGKKPKAIIPVHLYGMPANMNKIMKIAEEFDIPVIEDAAEALGSSINGIKCGTFGDFGILSFNGNKIITTSGGGALVSKSYESINKARYLATQARDPAPHYQHSQIGYNYRMSNISAGIGRGQMLVLNKWIEKRRKIYQFYNECFSKIEGVRFLPEPNGYFCNRWLTCITIDPRQTGGITSADLRIGLDKDNIESRPLWKPMHLQPVFSKYPYYGDNFSDTLFSGGLCLPSGSNLTDHDLHRIETSIKRIFNSQ